MLLLCAAQLVRLSLLVRGSPHSNHDPCSVVALGTVCPLDGSISSLVEWLHMWPFGQFVDQSFLLGALSHSHFTWTVAMGVGQVVFLLLLPAILR